MSTADLDHIRALLVAQTAELEPQAKGLFGRLFATRTESRAISPPPQRFATMIDLAAPELASELAPEIVAGPAGRPTLEIEVASPLPPPAPRAGFGRRPDVQPETELVLDQPATHARRLQLLDPSGRPVGEMLLHPADPPMRLIPTAVRDEVPFFPEDLMDHREDRALAFAPTSEPEPLRPWLKALRKSSVAPQPTYPVETPILDVAEAAPLAKRVRQRRAQARRTPPRAAPQPLGHDLLQALALTLAREHESLADRLLSVAQEAVFVRAFAEPVAA